ncbi:MAG: hypothetical protein SPD54_06455 [Parabacteroides sp.]|nr:hypothetical protein [Parabacteroides sp.]
MSTFLLTPKVNIPLRHGMIIEKGTLPFIVEIPFGHFPFDSIASKNRVKNSMMVRGIDISGHESILSSAFFDWKKL